MHNLATLLPVVRLHALAMLRVQEARLLKLAVLAVQHALGQQLGLLLDRCVARRLQPQAPHRRWRREGVQHSARCLHAVQALRAACPSASELITSQGRAHHFASNQSCIRHVTASHVTYTAQACINL